MMLSDVAILSSGLFTITTIASLFVFRDYDTRIAWGMAWITALVAGVGLRIARGVGVS